MDLSAINLNFWILQSIAMAITALLLPRLRITSFFGATVMVIALAMVNAHLWDAALFFSIPDSFSTHALLLLGSNALIFWVLVKVLPGIEMTGFLPALLAPIIFSVTSMVLGTYAAEVDFIDLADKGIARLSEARDYLNETKPANATVEKR